MKGVVVYFNDEEEYGFIRSKDLDRDAHVHINSIRGKLPLSVGQSVEFEVEWKDKGPSAYNVVPGRHQISPVLLYAGIASLTILIATVGLTFRGWSELLAYLLSINVVTFILYGYDKYIAGRAGLRVPEIVLYLLAFLGGSPAVLAGQRIFRHKTIKRSFQFVYWTIVVLQVAVLIYSLTRGVSNQ
ncbi:MAG: cold shock and DUF1294 domain-containing protein [candidate division Zixibacteria bacterium]|nr:cold shock and DUF1294 domain-containing protein [candidate division Zixibacteria bacterium]MDH3938711.1 cold shock and DUF1294 domain-containing protein [candidate division Zixibacteria bacterium]MDH4035773.1 cold shock and DUF1294 domain-containing protein [candidate division Zixibacteria bacterium]